MPAMLSCPAQHVIFTSWIRGYRPHAPVGPDVKRVSLSCPLRHRDQGKDPEYSQISV